MTAPSVPGVGTGRLLARTAAAEWTRLWTVRATWWCLAAAAVTTAGIDAVAGAEAAADPPSGSGAWAAVAVPVLPAQFALLTLVLLAVTSDHATGGIVPTLQWTPRRGVLLAARTLVPVAVATVLGVAIALAGAMAAFAAPHPEITLSWDDGPGVLADVALVLAAGTALAAGLGFLLRGTAGALVAAFLLLLVLPLLLPAVGAGWSVAVAEVLPGSGAAFLLLGGEGPGMTRSSSVAVLLAWAAGALLLGLLRLVRADADR
ncbi:hypothetical protein ACI8AV_19590 [Geodermatophilus sp. SYSU D00804]